MYLRAVNGLEKTLGLTIQTPSTVSTALLGSSTGERVPTYSYNGAGRISLRVRRLWPCRIRFTYGSRINSEYETPTLLGLHFSIDTSRPSDVQGTTVRWKVRTSHLRRTHSPGGNLHLGRARSQHYSHNVCSRSCIAQLVNTTCVGEDKPIISRSKELEVTNTI